MVLLLGTGLWMTASGEETKPAAEDQPSYILIKPLPGGTGNLSSAQQTSKAWNLLLAEKYDEAIASAEECIQRFDERAIKQQQKLKDFLPKVEAPKPWALNDVATCLFIKGRALRLQGKNDEAKVVFGKIIADYGFAQCWDPRGWYWKVAPGAKDEIDCIDLGLDYGDYTSTTLATKAWDALGNKQYWEVEFYANKCIDLFADQAVEMQKKLNGFAPHDEAAKYWALNDVATCLFIKGKAFEEQGKWKEAKHCMKDVMDHYSFAQCFDPRNASYWEVAKGARDRIVAMTRNLQQQNASNPSVSSVKNQ